MSSAPRIAAGVTYRFDRFELFPEAGQLRKGGMLVHLAPQPFRALLLLVSRAGTLVTREEIQQVLWGEETFVDFDQSVNAVIRRIRSALNDQVERPRFLQPCLAAATVSWRRSSASIQWSGGHRSSRCVRPSRPPRALF